MRALFARLRDAGRRWRLDGSGVATLEFALIAVPLFGVIFGVIFLGSYLFLSHQVGVAAREAAREVMLLDTPDEDQIDSAVAAVFGRVELPGETFDSRIVIRDDGVRVAVITASMKLAGNTPFFDISGFGHDVTLHAPLLDR